MTLFLNWFGLAPRSVLVVALSVLVTLVVGTSGKGASPSLAAFVGAYIASEAGSTEHLDVELVEGHLLLAWRLPDENRKHCWIARRSDGGLVAVNGVAADYRQPNPSLRFATDLYGDLTLESGGIIDVEHNTGDPNTITHWRRVSRTPNTAVITQVCGQ